ncbi:WXG100 family type VII secretion target [Streptomyces sp. NPDC001537]
MGDSYSKIAGNRTALFSDGQDLTNAASAVADVTKVLNGKVEALVNDAGWSGDAADNFKEDWGKSSAAAAGIVQALLSISTTMEHLATLLGEAQDDLWNAHDFAQQKGINLDSEGVPRPDGYENPHCQEYLEWVDDALKRAKRARADAEVAFASIVTEYAPKGGDSGDTLGTSDNLTLADAARSLYAIPAAQTAAMQEKVKEIDKERIDMKRAHKHMPKQSREWKEFQKERLTNRRALRAANKALADVEKKASKWKFSGATEIEFSRLREKLNLDGQFKMLDSIPILGTTVGLVGVGLATKDDMEKGWGLGHSLGVELGSAGVAMAAGTAVEGLAASGGASVAVGVAGSVIAGYGVGTYATELFKAGHWEHNIHSRGVISGIGHSFSDASTAWWDGDVVGVGGKIKNSAKSLWDDVF